VEQKPRQGTGPLTARLGIEEPGENEMPPAFDWDDLEDIAIALTDKFPDTDPLTVRFTDMHKWITELPLFNGDPNASNEAKLEAIQMAWHEEFEDRQ
jgi:FeS assembly protein IscX